MLGRVELRASLKRRATEEPSTASSRREGTAMMTVEGSLERGVFDGLLKGGDQQAIRP
jgi:hypothetical protein